MRFEHLVQINDPLNPLLDPLTREQLWRGLVRRAEQPTQFVYGLESFAINERDEQAGHTTIARLLNFGSFVVTDHVRLLPLARTETAIDPGPTWPASRLTITIEEPQPAQLFLRFLYEFESAAGAVDAQTDALRREAYKRADLDTVARIRELAERGELG